MKKSLFLVLAGIAVGAVAGLLLAPEEGEKTRKKWSQKAKKYKKDFEDTASEYKDKLSGLKDDIVEKANDLKKSFS